MLQGLIINPQTFPVTLAPERINMRPQMYVLPNTGRANTLLWAQSDIIALFIILTIFKETV